MTLPRDQIEKGFAEELSAFTALVRSLDDEQLAQPTRCEGWSVRDVAAHVVGTLSDIVAGRFEGLGTPEVTQRQVDERAGRSAAELADELDEVALGAQQLLGAFDDAAWQAEAPAGVARTVGWGVESLWYDAFVHGDDIRAAIGQASVPSDAMRASVSHVTAVLTDQGYAATTVALDGMEAFDVSGGSDERTITGDPLPFILAGTGRIDPSTIGLDETVNIYR
jgi:uncharacterized protein (TIGR03083 family)